MTHVPAPTTQWPVSENIRLVGSEKLGHKMLAFLLLVSDVTHSRVAKKNHIRYSSSRNFDVLGYKHKHWFPPGDALCRGGPAWLQNLQNDAFKPGILLPLKMASIGRRYASSNCGVLHDIVWYFMVLSCMNTVEVILSDQHDTDAGLTCRAFDGAKNAN